MTEKIDGDVRGTVEPGPEDGCFGRMAFGLCGHERHNLAAPFKAAIDLVVRERESVDAFRERRTGGRHARPQSTPWRMGGLPPDPARAENVTPFVPVVEA